MKNNQWNHNYWNISQGSSFRCYIVYFLLLVSWLHPFWNRMWYLQSANQLHHMKLQAYPESIWLVWHVHNEEARGVTIFHEYTLVVNVLIAQILLFIEGVTLQLHWVILIKWTELMMCTRVYYKDNTTTHGWLIKAWLAVMACRILLGEHMHCTEDSATSCHYFPVFLSWPL